MEETGLDTFLAETTRRLLESRCAAGHWEGELSSSALSTATAVFALSLSSPDGRRQRGMGESVAGLIDRGIAWLVANQNSDGGWGDTVRSKSNISTTALCWAALAGGGAIAKAAEQKAEAWLAKVAGSIEPLVLARAIIARYGKDRTFSVPILTMCALAGRLGEGRAAWRLIPQLPFELAACPQKWFQWLKLPVVSYALPALIAMGHVRHQHRPTWNPLARLVRRLVKPRTLRVLERIQPTGGGFLEATPLTSFVAMSLIGSGQGDHPVVARGVEFLKHSVREDGSWPIDTNLATWVTTLSINALAAHPRAPEVLPESDRHALADWLLGQQYRVIHPYTNAAPGAWAWTDLPGGVPDADDTAGALLALHHLRSQRDRTLDAAIAGVTWLLDLQNRDGGIPTFCRGWGNLPFDRSGADLTAHALQAWRVWQPQMPEGLQARLGGATVGALNYLARRQRADGSWIPLWFGNEATADESNATYGTARVLMALAQSNDSRGLSQSMRDRGVDWLLAAQNPDGSWGGERGVPGSVEETSLALAALAKCRQNAFLPTPNRVDDALSNGTRWLRGATAEGACFPVAPVGFYFAKLWYFERHYPLVFATGAIAQLYSTEDSRKRLLLDSRGR